MQTAASKGRYVIVERDCLGRIVSVSGSPSAASRGLGPQEERWFVHEPITQNLPKVHDPAGDSK